MNSSIDRTCERVWRGANHVACARSMCAYSADASAAHGAQMVRVVPDTRLGRHVASSESNEI